ncbi:MAG: alpha-amylase family glycosyl hydrolase, partial [Pseudomonadota bacterium]
MADRPYQMQEHRYDQGHPAVADFLRRVRALTDKYDATFTVAEVGSADPLPQMREFTAPGVLNSAYSFDFLAAPRLDSDALRASLCAWPNSEPDAASSVSSTVAGWPSWAFSNHDAPRVASRWTNKQPNARSSKLFALLLLSLRGNVFIYQGEELGLAQADIPFEQLVDPEAIKHWPKTMGRDGARTPMPWQRHAPHAGFSTHSPWLPIASSHATAAVDQQVQDPSSVLHFFRELLALRQASPALRRGHLEFLESATPLIVIRRWHDQEQWLSVINATDDTATFERPESTESVSRLLVGDVQGETTLTLAAQSAVLMRLT